MRIVSFCFAGLLLATAAMPSLAQVPAAELIDLEIADKPMTPKLQRGRQAAQFRAAKGLSAALFARRLGRVSAMAAAANGTIYVADQESGRIYTLLDRDQNGQPEQQRALPHRFDQPTGLAVISEALFVADQSAVWVIEAGRPPKLLARLANAKSMGVHRIAPSDTQEALTLIYTAEGGQSVREVSIDITSGRAGLIQESSASEGFVSGGGADPVLRAYQTSGGITAALGNGADPGQAMAGLSQVNGFALADKPSAAWPESLLGHVIAARPVQGDVIALPTLLGRVVPRGQVLLSGFASDTGRTKWGEPGALLMTNFGLLIADPQNGDIYRLSKAPELPRVIEASEIEKTPNETPTTGAIQEEPRAGKTPKLLQGSGIEKGITLERGSMIDPLEPISKSDLNTKPETEEKP